MFEYDIFYLSAITYMKAGLRKKKSFSIKIHVRANYVFTFLFGKKLLYDYIKLKLMKAPR